MAIVQTLTTYLATIALLLREPAFTSTGDFTTTQVTSDLNQGMETFLGLTGLAPELSDKYVKQAIVAGLDYTLPADLAALVRIEYQVGATGVPLPLPEYSFDAFDAATGGGQGISAVGPPLIYREPFNNIIRFNPQPGAGQVTGGDQIVLYYTTLGTTLVAGTDTFSLPPQFQMAPAFYCLELYWFRKNDTDASLRFGAMFRELVKEAKKLIYDKNQAEVFAFHDTDTLDSRADAAGSTY